MTSPLGGVRSIQLSYGDFVGWPSMAAPALAIHGSPGRDRDRPLDGRKRPRPPAEPRGQAMNYRRWWRPKSL